MTRGRGAHEQPVSVSRAMGEQRASGCWLAGGWCTAGERLSDWRETGGRLAGDWQPAGMCVAGMRHTGSDKPFLSDGRESRLIATINQGEREAAI